MSALGITLDGLTKQFSRVRRMRSWWFRTR